LNKQVADLMIKDGLNSYKIKAQCSNTLLLPSSNCHFCCCKCQEVSFATPVFALLSAYFCLPIVTNGNFTMYENSNSLWIKRLCTLNGELSLQEGQYQQNGDAPAHNDTYNSE